MLRRPGSARPVSYTHLDVYKRQLYLYSAAETLGITREAVSYTHLDVYKRQRPNRGLSDPDGRRLVDRQVGGDPTSPAAVVEELRHLQAVEPVTDPEQGRRGDGRDPRATGACLLYTSRCV